MWWGVLLGVIGALTGFFGLRRAFTTDGRTIEHERQKRYAEMIRREVQRKDSEINKKTEAKVRQIRRTTTRRRKKKSVAAARSFLSRTKEEQW